MNLIFTAGGTGGHLYPALAIIKELLKDKNNNIYFIGTNNVEKDIISVLDIPFFEIKMSGLNRKNLLKNTKLIKEILVARIKIKKLYNKLKPDIVIGFGGYISYVPVKVATIMNIKTIIHEQNVDIGLANKKLLKHVNTALVSFEETKKLNNEYTNIKYSGNPRGTEFKNNYHRKHTMKKKVIIYGGSLGSKKINDCVKNNISKYKNSNFFTYIITGKRYFNEFKDIETSSNYKILPYSENIYDIISECNLIVSRSGATTISELINIKLPAILIPSPNVTNNHQYNNAKILGNKQCAKIIIENKLDKDILFNMIEEILTNNSNYYQMVDNYKNFNDINSIKIFIEEIKMLCR